MESKKTQKAGDNSNQVQVGTALFIGITEERARAIIKEESAPIIEAYNEVAREIAQIRSEKFENRFIPTLVKDNLLESLKRPEILLAIQEAEKQAICTDEEKSYELLSKLLSNRIKYSNDRLVASSLKYATEVAIEVADEALTGLTVAFLMEKYIPVISSISQGLEMLNSLFGIIDLNKIPTDSTWLEQLYVLKLIRINSFGRLKKLTDYYAEAFSSYICTGIKKDSEKYNEAVDTLKRANLSESNLIINELNEEYVRLPLSKEDYNNYINNLSIKREVSVVSLSPEQQQAFGKVYELYEKNDTVLNENKKRFVEMWNKFQNLVIIKDWWDKIKESFSITSVGRVLAHVNVNNINNSINLPKLELKDLIK